MRVVRVQRHGNALALTVPATYLRELGWVRGDHMKLEIVDGTLVARPIADMRVLPRLTTRPIERAEHGKV